MQQKKSFVKDEKHRSDFVLLLPMKPANYNKKKLYRNGIDVGGILKPIFFIVVVISAMWAVFTLIFKFVE